MQSIRAFLTRHSRLMTLPMVAVGLALTLSISACGDDDDDDCGYIFADVIDAGNCEVLAAEFDCNGFAYDADDETCEINGCLICQDVDTDFDGDFDFDGDVDDDD